MKKYLSRVVCLLLFIVGLCILYFGFDYIISDDTSSQTRITFHDFYEENEVDYLFLGPSHSVRSINAVQLSDDLDASVFNLSTNAQDFIGAYYLIKEAVNSKQINHVFYEVSISRFTLRDVDETATYIISDYMKSPLIRAEYLSAAFGSDKYVNAFLRLRRNIDPQNLPEWEEMAEVYQKKHDSDYTQYVGTEKYVGKGQWPLTASWGYKDTVAVYLNAASLDNFTVEDIQDKEWEYFLKIIELCSDEGVDLTFYIAPYSELYLLRFEQYKDITQRVYDAAEANGINVVDFNKIKEEYLSIGTADFFDAEHVTLAASEKMASFLAQYIKNPDGDYFYDDINDRYPVNDEIKGVGYNRFFVTDEGEYYQENEAEGDITSVRLEISALSWIERPVNIRIWSTVKSKKDKSVWIDGKEIQGEKLNEYSTQFIVPYNNLKNFYKVDVLDPDTNEVIYETYTRFNMNRSRG